MKRVNARVAGAGTDVDVVAGERLAPVGQNAFETAILDRWAHLIFDEVGDTQSCRRRGAAEPVYFR